MFSGAGCFGAGCLQVLDFLGAGCFHFCAGHRRRVDADCDFGRVDGHDCLHGVPERTFGLAVPRAGQVAPPPQRGQESTIRGLPGDGVGLGLVDCGGESAEDEPRGPRGNLEAAEGVRQTVLGSQTKTIFPDLAPPTGTLFFPRGVAYSCRSCASH